MPAPDVRVRQASLPPRRPRDVAAEGVDCGPAVHPFPFAEPLHVPDVEALETAWMVVEQLVGDPPLSTRQRQGELEHSLGGQPVHPLGEVPPEWN